jgi:hypothetical protein
VFAALAVTNWIEHQTGWSIRNPSELHGATAPSRSMPEARSPPPPTLYPTISATSSPR